MNIIITWVKDIFLIILSLSFFRILLPDNSISKYADFVFSMVIMAAVLKPLTDLIMDS